MAKFQDLMSVIDRSGGFYHIPIEPRYRSHVNIPFRITVAGEPNTELEAKFLKETTDMGLLQLKVYSTAVYTVHVHLYLYV